MLGSDVRYALRSLQKNPLFAATAIGTFALAIGANTAIFSVVNAAYLRPLPYPDANRLVFVWTGEAERSKTYSFSFPGYERLRDRGSDFEGVAAYDDEGITVAGPGEPERLEGGRVSANFFSVLGIRPVIGRVFTPGEDRSGGPPLAVLSHEFWVSRYQSDANVLGRNLRIDGVSHTIIGVLPAGFQFLGGSPDMWRSRVEDTSTFSPASVRLGAQYLTVIGRLRKGVSLERARAEVGAIDHEWHLGRLQEEIVSGFRLSLFVTWGAVSCLLMIACANVANLLLARATARQQEISVRLAIGASRWRIARQLVTESLLLSVCGGVLGWPLAGLGVKLLGDTIFQTSHRLPKAQLDVVVVMFTLTISVAVGLAFGLAPALIATRGALYDGLRSSSSSGSLSRMRLRGGLVAAEFAMSLVLLAAAGLLMQSFLRMRTMSTGMRSGQVAMMWLVLMPGRYDSFAARSGFYDEVLRQVGGTPGVESAAIASRVDVMQPGLGYMVLPEGVPDTAERSEQARGRSISPGYLRLLGIPLLRGRDFNAYDTTSSAKVMLVNESFARRFFPGQDPIGKHVTFSTDRIRCEIVGVVRDVRSSLASAGANDDFYLPLAQRPWATARLLVRFKLRADSVWNAVRQRVQSVDPDQAVEDMWLLDDALANSLEQPRSTMSILTAFAAAGLLLAAMGIYGVMAYSVAQRAREIGIRIALGASSGDVRAMVMLQSMRLVSGGVAIGIPAAVALGRVYSSLLFGVRPTDPWTLAAVVGILVVVAMAASYVPAWRAMRVDPVSVLRAD